ncbi:DUF6894 family protein [Microvirga yunnanensis]|uniref:DUF6894 family protein n=1 Tax=Microvirga yunnanensis TaxID=2953740 RepID=UPI0021C81A05|nr:hypothetical protein [Microvirga sp. HBU67655]
MARYYFDVTNGKQIARDDEGSEFNNLDAAVQGAARSAAEIGTDRLAKVDISHVVIEVRDEQDQRVCTVTASMKINRHTQSPQTYHPWSA